MRIGTLLLALVCVLCLSATDAAARGHWEVTSAPGQYYGSQTDFTCLGSEGTCWTRYKWVEASSSQTTSGIYIGNAEDGTGRGFAGTDIQERMDDDGTVHYSMGDGGIEVGSEDELRQVILDLAGSSGE